MSKDIIKRLRADAEHTDDLGLSADAADRIEELESELREALSEIEQLKERQEFKLDQWRMKSLDGINSCQRNLTPDE